MIASHEIDISGLPQRSQKDNVYLLSKFQPGEHLIQPRRDSVLSSPDPSYTQQLNKATPRIHQRRTNTKTQIAYNNSYKVNISQKSQLPPRPSLPGFP